MISITSILPLFFKLFRIKDKKIRSILYHHIVQDIKKINRKKKDEKVNRTLQNFMYSILQDSSHGGSRKALEVMIELFRKGIWRDAKTVNVIASAIHTSDTKTLHTVLNFFLSPRNEKDDIEEDKEHFLTKKEIIKKFGSGNITRMNKKKKKLKQALTELAKRRKEQLNDRMDDRKNYNYSAILLINDPQGYAEQVYQILAKSNEKFETKVLIMNFISRLISCHRLILLEFYSFMMKYLQPHQHYITQLMSITAQSCHIILPPDTVEPLIKSIANNFVTDRRANEVIIVGLNTIREISLRCPDAMTETLLHDLIAYKDSNDNGVSAAAKSLISLYRVLNPEMLPKKLRVKVTKDDDESDDDEESEDVWESVDEGDNEDMLMEEESEIEDDEESESIEEENMKKKRVREMMAKIEELREADVEAEMLEAPKKRHKLTKEERKQTVLESRKERELERIVSKNEKINKPKSQKVLAKNKPYMMIKHSKKVREKSFSSLHDKKKRQGEHIEKLKKLNKKVKSKVLGK